MAYWYENPPAHVLLRGLFKLKRRPGRISKQSAPARANDSEMHLDLSRMSQAGMLSVRGKPRNGG